jgi:hypothetical protein
MSASVVRPKGRPQLGREDIGYATELINLARLRNALLADSRLSTRKYNVASKALQSIEDMLRELTRKTKTSQSIG